MENSISKLSENTPIPWQSPPLEHQDMEWAESIIAAEKGETHKMLERLKKDPDLMYITDVAGDTVFHVLARAGLAYDISISACSKIIEILRECQLENMLHKKNANGDTPLHLALKNKSEELACWLVVEDDKLTSERGDSLFDKACYVENKDGVFPRKLAEEAGFSKVLEKIPRWVRQRLSGKCSIEMRLVRKDLNDSEESVPAWIEPIPKRKRKDFLRASKVVISPEDIQKYIDEFGGNMLHWAADYGRLDLQQLLNQFMSDSDLASLALEKNVGGDFPLQLTLVDGHHEATALYFIELAPEVAYYTNRMGVSTLFLAIEKGCGDAVRKIFQQMPGTAIDSSLRKNLLTKKGSVAHAALKCRNLGLLDLIMKEIPESIDSLNEKGWRPLSCAAYKGYLDVVSYFLDHFPDSVTKYDIDASFPIHKAVAGGHVAIVNRFLLSCPSTIYHLDSKGRTILHVSICYGKADVFSYLKNKEEIKEILHRKDHEGKTILDLAKQLNIGGAKQSTTDSEKQLNIGGAKQSTTDSVKQLNIGGAKQSTTHDSVKQLNIGGAKQSTTHDSVKQLNIGGAKQSTTDSVKQLNIGGANQSTTRRLGFCRCFG